MIVTGVAGLGLGGCETGSSLFGSGQNPAIAAAPQIPKVSFTQIVGGPVNVTSQLTANVVAATERQNVTVARDASQPSEYKVRGYLVAAEDKKGTKLAYIWDVLDQTGARAHQITGEEFVAGKGGADPWSVVDQATIDRIATNTAIQLAAWAPTRPSAASTVVASGQPTSLQGAGGSTVAQATADAQTQSTTISTGASSGLDPGVQNVNANVANGKSALTAGEVVPGQAQQKSAALRIKNPTAIVPVVAGAPGDGPTALTKALQRQLSANGVPVSGGAGPSAYTVQGKVLMGQPQGGKQSINIEWVVFDPAGGRVGSVKQDNNIPQGSLDGPWGRTADTVAGAAIKGVIELIQRPTVRVN